MFRIKNFSATQIQNNKSVIMQRMISDEKTTSNNFQPQSRYEKIRALGGVMHPKSNKSKIIFLSNSHANGFVNERLIDFPADIPVQKMK